MIRNTEGIGAAEIESRLSLRELGCPGKALATPDPGTKARPDSPHEPEGALGVTMPWVSPLWLQRNAVQFATARMGGI